MHSWKSAITLYQLVCAFSTWLALNRFGSGTRSDQPSLQLPTAIKIRFFELPHLLGAGCPAIATFAILRLRRMARWKNLLRHSDWLRTVTCAASTNINRNSTLPCLLICPSLHRSPLDFSSGTSPT